MGAFWKLIFQLVLPVLVLVGLGLFFAYSWDTEAPLSVALAGSGLFAFVFFFIWSRNLPGTRSSPETTLRGAIAAAIVVEYLVLVAIVAFFRAGPEKLPALTDSMIKSFTAIVGVVVAFYFGSSAFIQVFKQTDEKSSPQKEGTHE